MKVINDYTCEKCGVIELLADPELVQYCPECGRVLIKMFGKLFVLGKKKGKWNED